MHEPPELNPTSNPNHHSQCCVSLSTTLIETLSSLLQSQGGQSLSIGSGTGLLEVLLLQQLPCLNLDVVELAEVNVYLDEERVIVVNHSGALSALAADSTTWIFVYPRSSKLIAEYVRIYGNGKVTMVVMLLPRCDGMEMLAPFLSSGSWEEEEVQQAGLVAWECMIVVRRRGATSLET